VGMGDKRSETIKSYLGTNIRHSRDDKVDFSTTSRVYLRKRYCFSARRKANRRRSPDNGPDHLSSVSKV